MFEKALAMKLRFSTAVGMVSTEDLFDLPLTSRNAGMSLDGLAKQVNRELKASGEESFVVAKSSSDDILELKLNILKHIIRRKLDEKDQRAKAASAAAKREKILGILANKEDESLRNMSAEELKKMLEEV